MPGVIVRDLTEDKQLGELIHGNELLVEMDPRYPRTKQYRAREHTLDNILSALTLRCTLPNRHAFPAAITNSCDLFVGYLMLDALIGNTDRHHENWAILIHRGGGEGNAELASSYDHASSLGRELTDAEREGRLCTRDRGYSVQAYACRARSALFRDPSSAKPLSTLEAFQEAAMRRRDAAGLWLERLREVPIASMHDIVARVPDEMMSEAARACSLRILDCNRDRLLATELV